MVNALYIYIRLVATSIRGQMQYRASFVLQVVGHMLATVIEFVAIWALFQRVDSIDGWSLAEVAMFYAVVNVAFAIADAIGRGFDWFGNMVKSGGFDRVLLRPRAAALQIMGRELTLKRFGRLSQGLVILAWASWELGIVWSLANIVLLMLSIVGCVSLFMGLLIFQATVSFWTVQSLEAFSSFTYGGVHASRYPMDIYQKWFRRVFFFVIPLGCVAYLPLVEVLGKTAILGYSPLLPWLAPSAGFFFLGVALGFWKVGIRHYCSTGS